VFTRNYGLRKGETQSGQAGAATGKTPKLRKDGAWEAWEGPG